MCERVRLEDIVMIDAKSFIEFFEEEFNIEFVDQQTGERVLDIIAESDERDKNSYKNSAYKSDYDRFLESYEDDND